MRNSKARFKEQMQHSVRRENNLEREQLLASSRQYEYRSLQPWQRALTSLQCTQVLQASGFAFLHPRAHHGGTSPPKVVHFPTKASKRQGWAGKKVWPSKAKSLRSKESEKPHQGIPGSMRGSSSDSKAWEKGPCPRSCTRPAKATDCQHRTTNVRGQIGYLLRPRQKSRSCSGLQL